jgi:hypothetical protein
MRYKGDIKYPPRKAPMEADIGMMKIRMHNPPQPLLKGRI